MIPIILDGPAVEPVGLAEMLLFLRLDQSDEDDLVTALIVAARVTIEAATRLKLIRQRWRLRLAGWPCGRGIALPLAPVIALDAVRLAGAGSDLAPGLYRLDETSDPARAVIDAGAPDAPDGAEIDVTVGFGAAAASVPEPLRLAIRILVARLYERRGDERAPDEPLPPSVRALIAPFVRARLA